MKQQIKFSGMIVCLGVLLVGMTGCTLPPVAQSIVTKAKVAPKKQAASDNERVLGTHDLLIGYQSHIEHSHEELASYHLDVPLYNQLTEPALKYGCEVTALGMLLAYYGFDGNKNKLQQQIAKEPYQDSRGLMGNPNKGFVGDATGEKPGTGVNHGPIANLAQQVVGDNYQVVDATGQSLQVLLDKVATGHPVWVVTSIDYRLPEKEDVVKWKTAEGVLDVHLKHHAAVLTGYDQTSVYLNDAYGEKKVIDRDFFSDIYQTMGAQAVYLDK
ncbi:hypothetical protein CBF34_00975 [Vagococcus penaei]|uniref:C39 family peptidase n=1 Tax=Vagococcus penaei TaxID=633807 RepID=UPI000F8824F6|nr:C39 family peptidase [Vagococcus penaei]RSU06688.1 hypothetical protein CBF34_00975 [Vagococcus penaei]